MQIHKFYLLLLFLPLLLPAVSMAQTPDTLYVFRFVSHKNMFYIPWKGNGTQLDHLLSLVEKHKAAILSGEVPLLVDGYCASEPTESTKTASSLVTMLKLMGICAMWSSFVFVYPKMRRQQM